jgi:SAM-dependent methyltransferase
MNAPADYLKPYREAVQQQGAGFYATLWNSRETQQLRFDVMIRMCDFSGVTLLDAGCGTGDLANHLIESGVKFQRYIGIDAVAEMIHAAQQRQLQGCEFHVADLVRDPSSLTKFKPDIVCFSGTLNTMDESTAQRLVSAAFDAANVAVIFNFLSDRADSDCLARCPGPARRFNTVQWIEWALTRTSRVSFTQDYMDGHDATILMRKSPP